MSFCGFMLLWGNNMSYCAAHPAKLSDFISGCCYTVIKICQQMATSQQKDFFVSSSAPTPTTDSQLYCDFAGGCPLSPLCFLWSPLWMYFFLLRVVYLSLLRMRAEPLVSCSSDETSWGSICSDPAYLPSVWLTIVVSSCCVFLDASSNFICSSWGAPCIIWPAHFFFFLTLSQFQKPPEPCGQAALPLLEHKCLVLSVLFCPGLDLRSVPGWDCSGSVREWC